MSSDISERILEKLNGIVTDKTELDMIMDLLRHEKRFSPKESHHNIKKQFQLLINQHYPLEDSKNE